METARRTLTDEEIVSLQREKNLVEIKEALKVLREVRTQEQDAIPKLEAWLSHLADLEAGYYIIKERKEVVNAHDRFREGLYWLNESILHLMRKEQDLITEGNR